MYSYEKSTEVAHLLPLRNNQNINSRFTKNTPDDGYHGSSFDKINRSTDYDTLKLKKCSVIKTNDNRKSWQGTPSINTITEVNQELQQISSRQGARVDFAVNSQEDYSPRVIVNAKQFKSISKTPALHMQQSSSLQLSPSQRSQLDIHSGAVSSLTTKWYTRMMRHSSRHWEEDPRFVQSLMRYNQVDHKHYNPTLESKQFRQAYKNTMNVSVPLIQQAYSKIKASLVNYELVDEEQLISGRKPKKGNHDIDPDIIYDRFIKDFQNSKAKKNTKEAKDLNDKITDLVQDYLHKIYKVPLYKPPTIQPKKDQEPQKIVENLPQMPTPEDNKPKTKLQLLMQQRQQQKSNQEILSILEAQRRQEEAEKESLGHHQMSHKEVDFAVEQLLLQEREHQLDRNQHASIFNKRQRAAHSVIDSYPLIHQPQSRISVDSHSNKQIYQSFVQPDQPDQSIRLSWHKNEDGGRKTAATAENKRARHVQLKQRLIINDLRSGGSGIPHVKAVIMSPPKEEVKKQTPSIPIEEKESSMFNYKRSTVGSTTGFKRIAQKKQSQKEYIQNLQKRSRSIEFDEKQHAINQLMRDCTNRLDQKLSQKQLSQIDILRQITDSEISIAQIIGEFQERDRKKLKTETPNNERRREFIGLNQYIEQKSQQQKNDAENFLSAAVIQRIKNDNLKLSGVVQLLKKVSKNSQNGKKKIWKPNPLILAAGVAELN